MELTGLTPLVTSSRPQLRPVSTQENKHRIGLDFFHLVLSAPPHQKKVENTSTLYHPGCSHRFKLKAHGASWYRKPMRAFNFVPIRSDPMLILKE